MPFSQHSQCTHLMRRSQLFVPGNDEKKIRKSVSLKADSIILDLEDAVPMPEKKNARNLLDVLLRELEWEKSEICVRINKIGTRYSKGDISFVSRQRKVTSIVLPKAEGIPSELRRSGKLLIPLIETPAGLIKVESMVRSAGVSAVSFGPADFADSVGGKTEAYSRNLYLKTKIVTAAAASGIDPIDCVFFDLQNLEGFKKEAMQSRDLGFVGKQVVHPSQVGIANEVYSPSRGEIDSARRLVAAYEKGAKEGVGAIRFDEKLVDAVHYRRAKALLEMGASV